MSKLFTVVGVSRIREQDAMKLRVANGKAVARAMRLTRGGHVEVVLFDTEPMNKVQALNWLEVNHPNLAAQIGNKQVQAVRAKAAKTAPVKKDKTVKAKVEKPAEVAPSVEVVDVALSPAAKLALKRAKDAARKREKRAAEKAAKLAAVA
jgi:hypothetical protein